MKDNPDSHVSHVLGVLISYSAYMVIVASSLVVAHRVGFHQNLNYEVASLETLQTAIILGGHDVFNVFMFILLCSIMALSIVGAFKLNPKIAIRDVFYLVMFIFGWIVGGVFIWILVRDFPLREAMTFASCTLLMLALVPTGFLITSHPKDFMPFAVIAMFGMSILMSYSLGAGDVYVRLRRSTAEVVETGGNTTRGHVLALSDHHVIVCSFDHNKQSCKLFFKDAVKHVIIYPRR